MMNPLNRQTRRLLQTLLLCLGLVSVALPSGEHVPAFPALFDGARPPRSATPHIGGPRRPVPTPQDTP